MLCTMKLGQVSHIFHYIIYRAKNTRLLKSLFLSKQWSNTNDRCVRLWARSGTLEIHSKSLQSREYSPNLAQSSIPSVHLSNNPCTRFLLLYTHIFTHTHTHTHSHTHNHNQHVNNSIIFIVHCFHPNSKSDVTHKDAWGLNVVLIRA